MAPTQLVPRSIKDFLPVQRQTSNSYRGTVPPELSTGQFAFGGFITALAASTVCHHAQELPKQLRQPHLLSLNITFLRVASVGEVSIVIEDVKLGKKISTLHFSMLQRDRSIAVGYASVIDLSTEFGLTFPTNQELLTKPLPADLLRMERDEDPNWSRRTFTPKAGSLVNPWTPFHLFSPRRGQLHNSITDGWYRVSLPDDSITNATLPYLADLWIRMLENYRYDPEFGGYEAIEGKGQDSRDARDRYSPERSAYPWSYPTLSLSLEVKRLIPEEGIKWVFLRAHAYGIINGRFDGAVAIFNEKQELLATSTQVSLVVAPDKDVERNKGKL